MAALALLGGCERVRDLVAGDDEAPAVAAAEAEAEAAPHTPDGSEAAAEPGTPATEAGAARKTGSVTKMMAAIESAKPRFPVYGVVADGTRMYTGPNASSPYLVAGGDDLPIPPHMRYGHGYGYGYRGPASAAEEIPLGRAVRILEMQGDFYEVENINAEDDVLTCAPLQPELAHVRVRLWVPRDSLVPVLDQPTTVRVDEHVKITLAPGVPAFATDAEDEFNVRADGITWKLELPEVPTARWHQPTTAMEHTGAVGTLGSWYAMTLEGKQFPPLGPSGRQMGQLYGDTGGTTWIFADAVKDGQARVRVKNRCMDIEGVVVTDARSSAPATGSVPASSRRRLVDRPPMVLAGTTLRWEDGTPAGIVVAPTSFAGSKRAQGQDVCFGITTEAGAPELCVAATEVEKAPAGASEADGLMVTANAGWAVQTNVQHALSDQLWEHYEDVRACFRPHLKKRGAYNSASANVSLSVKTDGKITVYWSSAWTMRGESKALGKCVEKVVATWSVDEPPATDQSVSLYLAGSRT